MEVTYLGHYGDDLTVVNAARVSFGKRVQEFRPDKDAPEFYEPTVWRKGAADIKQGSTDEVVELDFVQRKNLDDAAKWSRMVYNMMLDNGVCAEQARMLLPQNMYTEWHWTGSLLGWARTWNLRVKPDAQRETREVVEKIGPTMERLFPHSWKALTNG